MLCAGTWMYVMQPGTLMWWASTQFKTVRSARYRCACRICFSSAVHVNLTVPVHARAQPSASACTRRCSFCSPSRRASGRSSRTGCPTRASAASRRGAASSLTSSPASWPSAALRWPPSRRAASSPAFQNLGFKLYVQHTPSTQRRAYGAGICMLHPASAGQIIELPLSWPVMLSLIQAGGIRRQGSNVAPQPRCHAGACCRLPSASLHLAPACVSCHAQNRAAKGLAKLRPSIAEASGERRGVAPGSFVDLLVHATDKATGLSLTDLERTNQARA